MLTVMLFSLALGTDAQEKITTLRVRDAVELRTPVMTDQVNTAGAEFSAVNLLKSEMPLNWKGVSARQVSSDAEGWMNFTKADQHYLLYVAGTRMRAENFMKGKLKITSPVRWQLYVDGDLKCTKESAEDSLSQAQPKEVAMNLEPERDYEITLKLLSGADDKLDPSVKCEWIKDEGFDTVNFLSSPDLKKRFSLANTVYGNRVTGVSVSPDGRYLLTSYRDSYAKGKSTGRVVLSELKSGKVLNERLPEDASWMPASVRLYYKVKTAEGIDLYSIDPVTGREEVLQTSVPDDYFVWSPDESYLMYFPEEKGAEEAGPLKHVVTPDDRIPGYRNRRFLAKYDLATRTMERLTYGYHSTFLQDISADGSRILYSVSREKLSERPYSSSSLFELNLQDMSVDTLVTDEGSMNMAAYSPDGQQILVIAGPEAFDKVGMNCGSHPIANDFDTQAFILDKATGKVDAITKDFDPTVTLVQWNRGDGNIYFNTNDRDCRNIYRYLPKSRKFEKLPLEVDVVSKFAMADNNPSYAVYVGQTDYNAGMAYRYDVKSEKSVLLADPMKESLQDIEMGKVENWTFTASDGTVIDGMVCLPPSFDASKKYPLIVYYYGGTTPTEHGITSPYGAQIFASRDYVVYIVQPSGTIGYGQEFSARHVNAWGIRTADDIIEGVKAFCEAHPFVDSAKIGCLGASYGGFMTQYLQTRTDIFAAAVSHAGISNVTSYWGEGYWGYSYNSVAAADSYPWTNPDLFTKQGSLFNADKIHTPLLLLHGTVDTNVPMGESIQLFNALKLLGREVEFVQVEGEDHFVLDYDKRVIWQNSIMAWFERWLKGRSQWWDELYPKRYL